jgi:hypothetical protein
MIITRSPTLNSKLAERLKELTFDPPLKAGISKSGIFFSYVQGLSPHTILKPQMLVQLLPYDPTIMGPMMVSDGPELSRNRQ